MEDAMSEPTNEAPVVDDSAKGEPEADKPLGENGEKALKTERELRATAEKASAALQKQLDDINAANLSDLERAQKEAADSKAELDKAKAEAVRYRVAAANGISEEDAALFLTANDEETLVKQATRLKERTPTGPKPDPSQGAKGGVTGSSTAEQFAAAVDGAFTR